MGALALGAAVSGCSTSSADDPDQAPERPAARGVVLDAPGGKPVEGVELELMVWPAPQTGGVAPGTAPELLLADEAVSGADGRFELSALARELTPHAQASGEVSIEVRVAGSDQPGVRASLALRRTASTGGATFAPIDRMVLELPPDVGSQE